MRLIDADALEKFIKEKYKDGESTDDIKDQMLFDLSYQPTAYDVEKVTTQIEEMFGVDAMYYGTEAKWAVDKAKEIVKAGGINE